VRAGDYHVNFLGAGGNRSSDLGDALLEGGETSRKAGGYRRDRNPGALEGLDRGLDKGVVDADRRDADRKLTGAHRIQEIRPDRPPRLRAESAHPAGCVISR
jgi:hypothetical protein